MVYGYKTDTKTESNNFNSDADALIKNFSKKLKKSLNNLNEFLDDNKDKKIVFYAGGMQEYIILDRKENIIFANGDSELFGKKFYLDMPAITNPECLIDEDIDVIIIFASNYFDEIRGYLLDKIKVPTKTKIISIDAIIK